MHTVTPHAALVKSRAATLVARLWTASAPLTAVGLLMLVVAIPSAIGIFADPRIITGAPAWLKPLKFAISIAIYSLTLAWIFTRLDSWPRMRRVAGWTTAIVFVIEVGIIDLQAWRGTTSHFNATTPLNRTLFFLMGLAIMIQTAMSVWTAVALWKQRFADPALGWALRLGMTLTIAGALTGSLMTRPTEDQLSRVRAGEPRIVGAHTVGGDDGGAGLPLTHWSSEHGDVRVPHFIGLHAIQALAILALVMRRSRRPDTGRVRLVLTGAASYAMLFALLLWQALRGESVAAPDAATLTSLTVWAVLTILAVGRIGARARSHTRVPA